MLLVSIAPFVHCPFCPLPLSLSLYSKKRLAPSSLTRHQASLAWMRVPLQGDVQAQDALGTCQREHKGM